MTIKKPLIKPPILTALVLVVGLSACSNWQGDWAKVVISFGGADRAVYDLNDHETHQKLEHKIVLTGATETLEFSFTGGTTFEADVTPGNWNITVNSWLDGEIYATGSKDVVLKLGRNNETIAMYQAVYWWTWNAAKPDHWYTSTTNAAIDKTLDNTGYDVTVTGEPNEEWNNWASQFGRSYIATVGKTYRATWKWKAFRKPFNYVTIRYVQENQQDGNGDNFYTFGTNRDNLTIPVNEETKSYVFTVPDNCHTDITFMVGGDTGSFRIWDFKVEEVKLDPSIKQRITFSRSRGDVGAHGEVYDNWVGLYDIPHEVRGNGIKEGDIFTFNYTFTSDVTINKDEWSMSIVLLDNSETAKPQYWNELSDYNYNNFIHNIQANTTVSGTMTFVAAKTASSSAAEANRLAFGIDPADVVERHPTLTFTRFEFTKAQTVSGDTLEKKLDWLSRNAVDGGNYTVTVIKDENINSGNWLAYDDKKVTITLTGGGTVRLNNSGCMFSIGPNVTLILENIILNGRDNKEPLVNVFGGALIMNDGAVIRDNRNNDGGGGGVHVGVYVGIGKFTMNGGTISNNTSKGGGGVDIWGGSFIMNGGDISGNTCSEWGGGGVKVGDTGTFTMSGGTIAYNKADGGGGGVKVTENGTFIMSGTAEISDNTARESLGGGGVGVWGNSFTMNGGKICRNHAEGDGSDGGGVDVAGGTFTMNDGEISENTVGGGGGGVKVAFEGTTFTMNGGKISGNEAGIGGGVNMWEGTTFTMTGGEICNNRNTVEFNTWCGGGVHVNGTFNMSAGSIYGNTAQGGGGVNVYTGTFTMTGGEIYKNTVIQCGGGVNVQPSGKFTKSGGTIYGSDAGNYKNTVTGNWNNNNNGNGNGHAVSVVNEEFTATKYHREKTANPADNLDSRTGNGLEK